MKSWKNLLSFLILFAILLPVLSGCSEETPAEKTVTEEDSTAAEESERLWLDDLPDTDFDGAVLTVFDSVNSWNVDDLGTEAMKEVVGKAKYDRLINIQDRFNVRIEHLAQAELDYGINADYIRRYTQSGSYEFDFAELRCEYLSNLSLDGCFSDMRCTGEFDNFIDLSDPWWCDEFTQALNAGNSIYWLYGSTNNTTVASVYMMYFNKQIAGELFGEDFSLYDVVRDGSWTLDRLDEYTRDAYIDDGDGVVSENDQRALVIFDIDGMAIGAGVDYTKRDEDNMPYLNTDFDNEIAINEKLFDFSERDGVEIISLNSTGNFKKGNLLFFQGMMRHSEGFRDVTWDFGMIPLPKLQETDEKYLGPVLFEFLADAIPVTTPTERFPLIFTIMEAYSAEGYRTIRPAYLDEALKNKYSRDEDTKEMIDLCCAHVTTDFLVAYGSSTGMQNFFKDTIVNAPTRDITSMLARRTKSWIKTIDKYVNQFEEIAERQK